MKPNHHSLAYKQQKQPNKTYKDLKQKQKMKIADWMFRKPAFSIRKMERYQMRR